MSTKAKIALSLSLAALVLAPTVFAARSGGSGIAGKVSCSNGKHVTATMEVAYPDGTRVYTDTNNGGVYSFGLAPGNYYVAISSITGCLAPISLFLPATVYPNQYTVVNFSY